MLRACCDLLRSGGWLAFFTIHPAPGLDAEAYQRALALGPRAVATRRRDHLEMLATAGFEAVESLDRTEAFRQVATGLLAEEGRHETVLRSIVGDTAYDERRQKLEGTVEGIDRGILRRSLFLARRP